MDYEESGNLLVKCSSFDRFQTFLKIKDELNDKTIQSKKLFKHKNKAMQIPQ